MNLSERLKENNQLRKINKKRCLKCNEIKDLLLFYFNENQKYRRGHCQDCAIHKSRRFIGENKKLIKSGHKRCSKCEIIKPLEQFNGIKKKSYCKPCDALLHIERTYNLTQQSVIDILVNQNNSCSICKTNFKDKRFVIDHCHKSGKNRSILCVNCNTALGHIKDDISIAQSIVEYLKYHE